MTTVDVAVVGAGIIGCLTAREVRRRAPRLSVAVIDRDLVGSGASRRSAGVHFPRGATPRVRRMSESSHRYYERMRVADPALPIHPVPVSVVGRDTAGTTGAYLDLAGLSRAYRAAGFEDVPDAVVWRGGGCHYADVGAVAAAVARQLRPHVAFREGAEVTGLEIGAEGVHLHLGTGETVLARRVVLAPGPWVGARPWRDLVGPLGLRVKQVVALHVDRPAGPGDRLVVFHDVDAFLLPSAGRGHWLFSYTSDVWDVVPDELRPALDEGVLAEGRAVLARVAPELVAQVSSGRLFCDAYSPEREPRVCALDPGHRVVLAGAANGSGYRLAPAIAAEAVDLLRISSERRMSA